MCNNNIRFWNKNVAQTLVRFEVHVHSKYWLTATMFCMCDAVVKVEYSKRFLNEFPFAEVYELGIPKVRKRG